MHEDKGKAENKVLVPVRMTTPDCTQERILGIFNTNYVWLRTGRYGTYIECGDARTKVYIEVGKDKDTDLFSIELTIDDAIELLTQAETRATLQHANVLRMLDARSSIRVGKYGHYVFYWPVNAVKPRSVSLKKCPMQYLDCSAQDVLDWICAR